MYLVIQSNRVIETFNTREAAEVYKTHTQVVVYTCRKDAKKGDKVGKFRK